MDGAKIVGTESSTSITLFRVMNQVKLNKCTLFKLDSFTKYSFFKNSNDDCLYTNNIYFGWMRCGDNEATDFADGWIKTVGNNIGKEIIWNGIGSINSPTGCHQNDLKQVGSIKTVNTSVEMSTRKMILSHYLQKNIILIIAVVGYQHVYQSVQLIKD